jgi:hypothetical protein
LILDVHARAKQLQRRAVDRIGLVRTQRQVHAFARVARLDADPRRVERHRGVERERQLASRGVARALALGEQRAVEVFEVVPRERRAVEPHDHVVGVDVEVDPRGAQQRRSPYQQEHVAPGVGQLELTHLRARLLAIERELADAVERGRVAQLTEHAVDAHGDLISSAAAASAACSVASSRWPRKNCLAST